MHGTQEAIGNWKLLLIIAALSPAWDLCNTVADKVSGCTFHGLVTEKLFCIYTNNFKMQLYKK